MDEVLEKPEDSKAASLTLSSSADAESELSFEPAPPRTWTVLGLLAMTALIFSYLGSYAMAGALVNAEIIRPWTAEHDPRPAWLISGFVILLTTFLTLAGIFRWLSRRQLRAIDAMGNDE